MQLNLIAKKIMSKSTSSKPDADELLRTNSLSHKEIILRIDHIRKLLSNKEVAFDEKQLRKLQTIIEKSRYKELGDDFDRSKEIPDQIDYSITSTLTHDTKGISEKYFTRKEIESINEKIQKKLDSRNLDLKLRPPRESIRESDNAKYLKQIVFNKTTVKKDSPQQGFFTLEYPSDDESVYPPRETFFKIIVNFEDEKFNIKFLSTFKENDSLRMKPEDHLFPEEVQMAMFENLITQYPQIEEKLKTAKKINCIQDNIINDNSLARISRYLGHIKDNPLDREAKKDLISSPNQSNTQNFMNQLKLKFDLDLEALPPKTLAYRYGKAINLKQTFAKRSIPGS